ncbi:MAG TPA: signal peptide peptidase SppA [Gammaproteobacteria bacterium]|nr:signal peptide peptidase SppA [Gammaproteobacteria bacterium]
MEENKTRFQRFKENPLGWMFTGDLFFLTLNSIFLMMVIIAIFSIFSSIFSSNLEDPEGKALVINPYGPIVEQVASASDPLDFLLVGGQPTELYVGDLLEVLEVASKDERVKDLVLRLDNISGTGQAVLYDVGVALKKVKDSGKRIIAIGDDYSESGYYLASFADEIIMNTEGWILIDGFGRSKMYYKSFLDKLKISFNIFRVGTFKSAVEPYLRDDMSEAAKEANLAYLDVLWSSWVDIVSENRSLTPNGIQYLVDNTDKLVKKSGKGTAEAFFQYGMVDKLLSRIEQREYLLELFGESESGDSFNQISGGSYFQLLQSEKDAKDSENRIAVVVARGTIVDGEQPPGLIGGDSTSRIIKDAHEDENVKAIVLRVDSGGGGVFASEIIRQELIKAKEKGIKVVASMSNVAASGGYWISANADEIWASHNTITGSIGIFGMIPSVEKSLDHVGIHTDGVSTGKLDADFDPTKSLDPMLANIIQAEIEYGYDQFISLVSESRGIDKKQVDKIAQGRVWAGKTALELGLVDKLGNLKDAIDRAAELAEIDNFRTYYPAEELDWKQELLSSIFSISGGIIPKSFKENFLVKKSLKALSEMESFNDPKGIYVRCEDC